MVRYRGRIFNHRRYSRWWRIINWTKGGGGGGGGLRNSYASENTGGGLSGELPLQCFTGVNYAVSVGGGGALLLLLIQQVVLVHVYFAHITGYGGGGGGNYYGTAED